ncbi:MAG: NTP transferase domain-containing protein [Chloroflexi bacterium]|nr:NTP transferase domain-containing protein [Chloroflexota bacterium]
MKGVIIAAGLGGRLRPLTLGSPKILLEVGGRPLGYYVVDALYSSGVSEVAVVVGYRADTVVEALRERYPDLAFRYNEDYEGGNALSVYAARDFVQDEPFVLCMGDHPIAPEIVGSLLLDEHEGSILCVDTEPSHLSQMSDATKVVVDDDGWVEAIGKDLQVWNAVDTGVFKMTSGVFTTMESLTDRLGLQVTITDVVRSVGEGGLPFRACDVGGMLWADVDTPEDYLSVDALLREAYGERV